MTVSLPCCICDRTAPVPVSEASLSKINISSFVGKAKTGADVFHFLRLLNTSIVDRVQVIGDYFVLFLQISSRGFTRSEYFLINRR